MTKKKIKGNNIPILEKLDQHPFIWLLLGLVLTLNSYGAFNGWNCGYIRRKNEY